jgi:hypothetical protein
MSEFSRIAYPVAKKRHRCDAREFIIQTTDNYDGCKGIKAGDKYYLNIHKTYGEFFNYKSCLPCKAFSEAHEIDTTYEGNC